MSKDEECERWKEKKFHHLLSFLFLFYKYNLDVDVKMLEQFCYTDWNEVYYFLVFDSQMMLLVFAFCGISAYRFLQNSLLNGILFYAHCA